MTIAWFIIFIVLLFIELITVNLVTIWFAIGAVAALVSTIFTDSFVLQLCVFSIISVLALLLTKPIIKKFKGFEVIPTNFDRVIGMTGVVTKKITKNQYGEVKVFGNLWTASSDHLIDVDKKVKVLGIDGVKLIVKEED